MTSVCEPGRKKIRGKWSESSCRKVLSPLCSQTSQASIENGSRKPKKAVKIMIRTVTVGVWAGEGQCDGVSGAAAELGIMNETERQRARHFEGFRSQFVEESDLV